MFIFGHLNSLQRSSDTFYIFWKGFDFLRKDNAHWKTWKYVTYLNWKMSWKNYWWSYGIIKIWCRKIYLRTMTNMVLKSEEQWVLNPVFSTWQCWCFEGLGYKLFVVIQLFMWSNSPLFCIYATRYTSKGPLSISSFAISR